MIEKDSIAENKKLKEELEKYRRLEIELSTEIELLREGLSISKLTFRGQLFFGRTIANPSDSHFENDFG